MKVLIYDIENVALSIIVNVTPNGYFFCPNCQKGQVKLSNDYFQMDDPHKYTIKGVCPLCNHIFYKALN
jgi:hypothetical protein